MLRTRLALGVSMLMVTTLLQAAGTPASAAEDAERPEAVEPDQVVEGSDGLAVKPRPASHRHEALSSEPRAAWPEGGVADIPIPGAQPLVLGSQPADVPVRLTSAAHSVAGLLADGAEFAPAEVELLDRAHTEAAGVDGVLFSVDLAESIDVVPLAQQPSAVGVELDYSGFADAYGGGYGSRLGLAELPACVLDTPEAAECQERTPVSSHNDTERQTLSVHEIPTTSDSPTVLAAVAEEEGKEGDYKATDLSPSATWDVGLNTGDFTWSYDMPVPDVPGGLTPNVDLSYSSGSIDGRTGGTNNQGSWAGDGFDLWPGYIERKYKSCAEDDVENSDGHHVGDLCWDYDNAFISFNGQAGELVPDGDDRWKLKSDDGTRIERLTGSNRGNGARDDEHWRVTTPGGTKYYFGYNRLPGWSSGDETTESTWTVPVFGNDSGDPCHASDIEDAWCQQGWRWNLDYVEDTHGNAVSYYYDEEENFYGRFLEEEDDTRYTRGGTLDRIEYGLPAGDGYGEKALAKVEFTNDDRCLPGDGADCSDIDDNPQYWYDTPWDLNCDEAEDCDSGRFAPSFWTTERLTGVATKVLDGDSYEQVDSWKLGHHWGSADVDYQLLLSSVQQTGHTDDTPVSLPPVTFGYTQLVNRMDETGDGYAPFVKARLSSVADEAGGQIDVEFSGEVCDRNGLPDPESNTTRCFPQYLGGGPDIDPDLEWFNKYVVEAVTATDRSGGAPDELTRYDYRGGAAWHFDDDNGMVPDEEKTWSQWRGYGHVRVQSGGQSRMSSQSDSYFLRGMDGDRKNEDGGKKSVEVELGAGEGDPITDHASAVGFPYKSVEFDGPDGKVLEKSVSRPWRHETAREERDWGTITANFTGTSHEKVWTSLDEGGGSDWRTTEQFATHDTVAGRVTEVDDRGDTATTDDDQCVRTTYATNSAENILDLPSRTETVAVRCSDTPDRAAQVISDERYAYDGGGYGEAPTRGDLTATAELKEHDGTVATYLESSAAHDGYGRELTSTDLTADITVTDGDISRDERSDGLTSTTSYSPATGFPAKITKTTPPAVTGDSSTAQTTVTETDPRRGTPVKSTDTNGKETVLAHDALGRSVQVWLPDREADDTPNFEFTYDITDGQPVAVGTKTLGNDGTQDTSYVIYDGFLRERQTQKPGPEDGRLLTDIFYDERGLVGKTFAEYYTEGSPSGSIFQPDDAIGVESQTRHTHDGLGRETEARHMAGSGDGGDVLAVIETRHSGDRTTVIPPEGGTATTTIEDARGNPTELRQHHERDPSADYDTTTYQHTPRGELAKVTDPAGNEWSYTYDQLGRKTATMDPDAGETRSEFDDRDQLTERTDARGETLVSGYDNLGRRTELRENGIDGPLRAEWTFDDLPAAQGQPVSATRYENGEAYVSEVLELDELYRPLRTQVTIPDGEGALAGSYESATGYTDSGLTEKIQYPAAGNLPELTLTPEYEDGTLRPTALRSSAGVYTEALYSLTGKPLQFELKGNEFEFFSVSATNTYEWGTQRLKTARVDRLGQPGVDRHETYDYDQAGNVLSIEDVSRTGTDTQCFDYDYLRRLTEAWSEPTVGCVDAPSDEATGGPAEYWHSYTYDKVGNRLTETRHEQDIEREYSYPAAGEPQPHTLTSVVEETPGGRSLEEYGYDEVGNTSTRQIGGDTEELFWDPEGHLASVEGPSGPTAEYLYDAEGQRLIGRTDTETTLYLGHTEITVPAGSDTPSATRYFDGGGGHMVIMEDNGATSFVMADHHGTGQLAVEAVTLALQQRRTLPFGQVRGETPEDWPGSRGFVGGTDDGASTGLTHLGAREYDPDNGRFISLDPVMDLTDPQQIHGYTYANNNPLAYSDPHGLAPDTGGAGGSWHKDRNGNWSYTSPTKKNKAKHPSMGQPTGNLRSPKSSANVSTASWGGSSYGTGEENSQPVEEGAGGGAEALPSPGAGFDPLRFVAVILLPDIDAWMGCIDSPDIVDCGTAAMDLPWGKWFKFLKVANQAGSAGSAGRRVAKCNSFLPGTGVLMADGNIKPIEEIEIGDEIVASDPATGETTTKTVTAEILGEGQKSLVTLTTVTEEGDFGSVTATEGHPFWVPDLNEWVDAGDLLPGTWLKTSAGTHIQLTAIDHHTEATTVHNLTVEGIHTYYVLAGQTPVLVHNSGGCPDLDALSQSGMRAAKGKTTHAGREYQKHMNRGDLPVVPGKQLKSAGQDLLDDILTNPKTATSPVNSGNFAGGSRYIMPDPAGGRGIGATFDANGQFQFFGRY